MSNNTFMGYRRSDGAVGVRNHVAIIPSCGCALRAAQLIAAQVEGAVLLDYNGGCGEIEADIAVATRLLGQFGRHPNVIGSVVVSLGCETLNAQDLAARIATGVAPTELLVIQQLGGTRKTVARGVEIARAMASAAHDLRREPCSLAGLTVALECGGSDATSGMAANPAMGAFSDLMVAAGAKVILAETSELLGAEHVLTARAATPAIAQELLDVIDACERFLKSTGEDFINKQPSPGNIRGGITTVEEKALGDVLKGGTTPIVEVLKYGQPPSLPGLSFMDTPGNDLSSVVGLVAAGSQLVVFTTGRGNPMGNAIAPVIKVTGNAHTYQRMQDDMDLDASSIISGEESVAQVGQRMFELALRVIAGEETAAEELRQHQFMMLRQGPVF